MSPLSGVLSETWQTYRAHPLHFIAIAFVLYLVSAVVTGLLALLGEVGALLGDVVVLIVGFLLQAALIKAVQDVRDGRVDLSLGETVSAATPYIWPVAVASVLAGIAIAVGLVLIIVPGLILITIWAVIVPVIVIERSGPLQSFGRSQRLVRGYGWQVFGTLVLVYLIIFAVDVVLGIVFSALPAALGNGLSTVISGSLVAPFLAIVVTLMYYRLVAAHEGGMPGSAPGGGQYGGGQYGGGQYGSGQYGGPPSGGGTPYDGP